MNCDFWTTEFAASIEKRCLKMIDARIKGYDVKVNDDSSIEILIPKDEVEKGETK